MQQLSILIALSFTFITSAYSATFQASSIPLKNYTPIISSFAFPQIEIADFDTKHKLSWTQTFNVTNYISKTIKPNERLAFDGETWEYIHSLRYTVSQVLQFGLQIPRQYHTGGRMDRFIFNFHDLFQLPQNGRSDLLHDKLYWSVSRNNYEFINLDSNVSSYADSIVSIHWKPTSSQQSQINAAIKFPTGSVAKYSSSGTIDSYISFATSNPDWLLDRRFLSDYSFSLWYGAGIGYLGQHHKLRTIKQNSSILSLRGGFAWLVFRGWEIKLQIDTHTPIFDSNFREFGWYTLQFTTGTAFEIGKNSKIELYLAEDLRPRSAPDVTFSSAITFSF